MTCCGAGGGGGWEGVGGDGASHLWSRGAVLGGDLLISNIECIEMLSSPPDLCLIFIKTAEAAGDGRGSGSGTITAWKV